MVYGRSTRDEEFSVSSARNLIDDKTLGTVGSKTHWCKLLFLMLIMQRDEIGFFQRRLRFSFGDSFVTVSQQGGTLVGEIPNPSNIHDFFGWLDNMRLSSSQKALLEVICGVVSLVLVEFPE
ncbi:hypothetical protein Tco_0156838 [Tanacetum coccineum]